MVQEDASIVLEVETVETPSSDDGGERHASSSDGAPPGEGGDLPAFRPEDLQQIRTAPCRIHDIIIEGNARTKHHVIERELEDARSAENFTELAERLVEATERLRRLDIFKQCQITCEAGPSELPGTTNVVRKYSALCQIKDAAASREC